MTKNVGIIFAGGVGSRMGESSLPKQFIEVSNKPILVWTLDCFEKHPLIDEIYLACKEEWIEHTQRLLEQYKIEKVKAIVPGGNTAQHSIYNALTEARLHNTEDTLVLIHDGVRPFVTDILITNLVETALEKGNAITSTPCQETIIVSEDGINTEEVPLRRHTFSVQAPQTFFIDDVMSAYEEVRKTNPDFTDIVDACTLFDVLGREVNLVRGNVGNIKITNPEDVYILEGLFGYRKTKELLGLPLLDAQQAIPPSQGNQDS
ncbi:MAG: 2-C-methyl-D-erythritol 4-phosphate cytidylyltransferase [Eggerthellaceae bacterium]|nr:2-C-methyl-D-erythritol 4-phosphate cytidylyltransferase [Eggerthellaceae bacterium]